MSPSPGGWNQRVAVGVARCACRHRRLLWARLDPRASEPCCTLPCCMRAHAVIVSSREDILALRTRAHGEHWKCPRCGQLVALHQRNFECVDATTRALRARRVGRVPFRG